MRKTYYRHDEQESLLKSELSEFVADLGKGETLATYFLRLMDEKGYRLRRCIIAQSWIGRFLTDLFSFGNLAERANKPYCR